MAKKIILEREGDKQYHRSIEMLSVPSDLKAALNPLSFKILKELGKRPSYPLELAKKLGVHEQKIYYHINRLKRSGLIELVKEEIKQGAVCNYFAPAANAFGIDISQKKEEITTQSTKLLKSFFHEFIKDGVFNGSIVVGSPSSHGPFLTSSRDGHYAVQLAMFLGGFCQLPKKFIVKLDTEIKAENAEKRNMILIGGPITNMISNELNEHLETKFEWKSGWKIKSGGKEYINEDVGLIVKTKNPWDKSKTVIMLAGLKYEGTKTCILGLTQYSDLLLSKYTKTDYYRLVRGLDLDGDGKVDDIEILS